MATNESSQEWTTVSEDAGDPETKIVFDTLGDEFVADIYLGMRELSNEQGSYQQARFEKDGEIYFTNANYSLRNGLKNVRSGTGPIKLTFSSETDTGQRNPMRNFTVQVAKPKGVTNVRRTSGSKPSS